MLNSEGALEITLPSDDRGPGRLGPGDIMIAACHRGEHTMKSRLPHDEGREVFEGWRAVQWCGRAHEFRGLQGEDVVTRREDGTSERFEAAPEVRGRSWMFTSFADEARRCVRWKYHAKQFDLLEW